MARLPVARPGRRRGGRSLAADGPAHNAGGAGPGGGQGSRRRGMGVPPMARREDDGGGGLDAEDLAAALRVLRRVAEDRAVLAGLEADTRILLQRLAGEVARPDLKARKKLQRALLR